VTDQGTPETDGWGEHVIEGDVPPAATEGAAGLVGRTWLMREVRAWMDTGSERFLVIAAEPGWGKSAFAAWLVGPGRDPADAAVAALAAAIRGRWSAWHFCTTRGGGSIQPSPFSTTLAAQLGSRLPEYSDAIVTQVAPEKRATIHAEVKATSITGFAPAIYLKALYATAKDPRDEFDLAVRRPLLAMARAGAIHDPIFVLVDGLDEALDAALEPGTPTIVDLLAGSLDLPDEVRFLVTTRREPRVVDKFAEGDRRIIYASDPANAARARDNDADIQAYVTERLGTAGLADRVKKAGQRASVTQEVVADAAGNFLVAQLRLGEIDETGDLPDQLPGGLNDLYRSTLERLMPETRAAGISEKWTDAYQPVLGALSVARPGAPMKLLTEWLGRERDSVDPVILRIAQVIEEIPADGGSRRLYNRSLAEFLALPDIRNEIGDLPNRYFVNPGARHRQIVDFYLAALRDKWSGDWNACDPYALRELVGHLFGVYRWTDQRPDCIKAADELCDLALNADFQNAQRQVLGGPEATVEACRLALLVSVEIGDVDKICERAKQMALSWEPTIRTLAARVLSKVAESKRDLVLDQLKQLVQ